MENDSVDLFIIKCRAYVDFMLSQQQWSGITKEEVVIWMRNFSSLTPTELRLVYKLLTNLIYYSEKDVINILHEGLYNSVVYDRVLEQQKQSDFYLSTQRLDSLAKEEIRDTCFVPLLDSNAPHESGNYINRLLVQQEMITTSQSCFLSDVVNHFSSNDFKRLVIIDDCVGSGNQLRTFWEKNAVVIEGDKAILLRDYCSNHDIEVCYLTLFGYLNSINSLQTELPDLRIICGCSLTDSQRVFMENSYVWANDQEKSEAIELFSNLTKNAGIPLYGYASLDFAFIMHKTIPDWSLPIFWKENSDWHLLLRRKNSNE